jgi:serine/threonine-protein kinase
VGVLDSKLQMRLDELAATLGLEPDAAQGVARWVAGVLSERTLAIDSDTLPDRTIVDGRPVELRAVQTDAERYTLLTELGEGGMGRVLRVHDRALNRRMAMKLLRSDRTGSLARFVAEAQVTSQLQHPGIGPVHELGRLPDGRMFFTMKEVRGRTLGQVIQAVHSVSSPAGWQASPGGWTLRGLVRVLARVCEAVGYAHSRGVVHRDLKPSNVLLGEFGEVQVVDWGVAKVVGVPDPAGEPVVTDRDDVTRMGEVIGTPAYMAPEQAYGWIDRIDARSDVYAIGAMLYEALSGHPPYRSGGQTSIVQQVLAGPPLSVARADGPPLDPRLVAICERAMARELGGRYPDASTLGAVLEVWMDGRRSRTG